MIGNQAKEKFNTNPGMGIENNCKIILKANRDARTTIVLIDLKTLTG
jgi:hypothetical protein